jgi:isoquinoline 1-oxidoreductase beta subunit
VVAYVVEASVSKDGTPKLHSVTAGVHCNLAVNPKSVEAQVQGGALMGLSMCLPGAAITLKDGVVEQSNFGDFAVPRITDMPQVAVHIVPSAEPPKGMGEPGLPPLAPAFANAVARLTGKTPRDRETGRQSVLRRSRRSPRSGRGQLMWGSRTLCRQGSQRKPTRCRRC